jgi:pseudouridine-5'-phosphate glycosidase
MRVMSRISIHPEVRDALESARPVVALESAVITTGLPREVINLPDGLVDSQWRASSPLNLETARCLERAVRASGAIPATIALIDGTLRIGLSGSDLERLATDATSGKASSSDLAAIMAADCTAGTTVSGTIIACAASASKIQNPKSKIQVFATGGIGGVHRHWIACPDISADLKALASTPLCVVCAGAKSMLDVPATLEALHTLGVPVVGWRTDVFPQFHSRGDARLRLAHRVDDAESAARLCAAHWQGLKQSTAVVLANPVPQPFAMAMEEVNAVAESAESEASRRGITGSPRTPFVLGEMSRLTGGRTLHANLSLLINNAARAAEVAVAMAGPVSS